MLRLFAYFQEKVRYGSYVQKPNKLFREDTYNIILTKTGSETQHVRQKMCTMVAQDFPSGRHLWWGSGVSHQALAATPSGPLRPSSLA